MVHRNGAPHTPRKVHGKDMTRVPHDNLGMDRPRGAPRKVEAEQLYRSDGREEAHTLHEVVA